MDIDTDVNSTITQRIQLLSIIKVNDTLQKDESNEIHNLKVKDF